MRSLRIGQYSGEVHSIREVPSKFEGSRSLSRLEVFFGIKGVDRPVRTWMDPDLDFEATFGCLVSALGFDPNEYGAEPLDTKMLVGRRCQIVLELIERVERAFSLDIDLDSEAAFENYVGALGFYPNGYNAEPLETEMRVGRRCEIALKMIELDKAGEKLFWLEPVDFHPIQQKRPCLAAQTI